jgi:hypothetical protein
VFVCGSRRRAVCAAPGEVWGGGGRTAGVARGFILGEKIVVDGAFHLNNERRRRAVRGGGEG